MASVYGASTFIDRYFYLFSLTCLPRDVVLVAINYRLGPLGFYSLGDEKVLVTDSSSRLSENFLGSRQCRVQRPGSCLELGVRKHCQLWGRPRQGKYIYKAMFEIYIGIMFFS